MDCNLINKKTHRVYPENRITQNKSGALTYTCDLIDYNTMEVVHTEVITATSKEAGREAVNDYLDKVMADYELEGD